MTKRTTIDRLQKICEKKSQELLNDITDLAHKLPIDVMETYKDEGILIIQKIIEQANTGHSLYWHTVEVREKYRWDEHSSELHEELHLYIRQFNIIYKMLEILNNRTEVDEKKQLQKLRRFLDAGKIHVLNSYEEPTSHFLKAIGINPKYSNKSSRFWVTVPDEESEPAENWNTSIKPDIR